MLFIGIQDYPMPAAKWLDAATSVSWLKAFEKLAANGHVCHAILQEHHVSYHMSAPIRGVYYHFFNKEINENEDVFSIIHNLKPDVLMYNCCGYNKVLKLLSRMQSILPACKHILRTHHEVKRVMPLELAARICMLADGIIVSTQHDIDYIQSLGITSPTLSLCPFGVDIAYFGETTALSRDIDVSASCSLNPVKNGPLLAKVFEIMKQRGKNVVNILGQSPEVYRNTLQRSKVYFAPTLSEASGSRSLLEAITAGAYPVCSAECESTMDLIKLYNGTFVSTEKDTIETICNILEDCLENKRISWKQPTQDNMEIHSDDSEITTLINILSIHDEYKSQTPVHSIINTLCTRLGYQSDDMYEKITKTIEFCRDRSKKAFISEIISKEWEKLGLPLKYQWGFLDKIGNSSFNLLKELEWVIKDIP